MVALILYLPQAWMPSFDSVIVIFPSLILLICKCLLLSMGQHVMGGAQVTWRLTSVTCQECCYSCVSHQHTAATSTWSGGVCIGPSRSLHGVFLHTGSSVRWLRAFFAPSGGKKGLPLIFLEAVKGANGNLEVNGELGE